MAENRLRQSPGLPVWVKVFVGPTSLLATFLVVDRVVLPSDASWLLRGTVAILIAAAASLAIRAVAPATDAQAPPIGAGSEEAESTSSAEEALQASEARFRRIAETIEEVFWMADEDIQTTIYVSPAYERVWGRTCDSLYWNPRSFLEAIHPDDRQRVIDNMQVKTSRRPFDHEYRIVRPDGTVRWIWDRGFPLEGEGCCHGQYVGVAQDITERRQAEEALGRAEERMRYALEAAQVGVWEANLLTGESYWSPTCEAMHGLAPGTFGGTFEAFVARMHLDDRAQALEKIERALGQRTDADLEYRTAVTDRAPRWIRALGRFTYNDAGTPIRGAGVVLDITERRALEEQLRQAQKMEAVGQLAGGIAHDFNNMLTAILGNAELFLDELPPGDRHRAFLEEILMAGRRSAALTLQLLAFSRRQVLTPRVLRLGEVVTAVAPMLRRLIGEGIELRTVIGDHGHIKADEVQIEQVLVNMAVNARDAMGPGGRLTIETADVVIDAHQARHHPSISPGTYVTVAVSDTGHGMDLDTQARLFEPFFTTKPKGQGTGLGLAMAYGIVTQSGGAIGVASEMGRGTTFTVYLPWTQEAVAATPAPTVAVPGKAGSETVLLVEDEAAVRGFVSTVLTRQGYQVHAMSSPAHAIEFASAHHAPIHGILADLALPGMNGQDMVAELVRHHPEAKVLYMSGYKDDLAQEGPDEADVAFLQKPFTTDALIRRMQTLLDPALVSSRSGGPSDT